MRLGLVWLLPLAALVVAAAPVPPPPLSAYGRLPTIDHLEISPDGARMAAVVGAETERQIQIRDTATNALIAMSPVGDAKVRSLQWVGPDILLAVSSTTTRVIDLENARDEWFTAQAYDLKAKRWRRLLENVENAMNVVAGEPTVLSRDGKWRVILPGVSFPGREGVLTLFEVDPATGQTKRSEVGNGATRDWLVDARGIAVARAEFDDRTAEWRLFVRTPNGWTKSRTLSATIDTPDLLGVTPDGAAILVENPDPDDDAIVSKVALADGGWTPAADELNGDGVLFDPATHTAIGGYKVGLDKVAYRFIAPADAAAWSRIERAFKGDLVTLASWSADRSKIIVRVDGPTQGYAYYFVDVPGRRAEPLGTVYQGIEVEHIARKSAIVYKAADGLALSAYLTLPNGRAAKRLPLVVLAHGGPAARDDPGFDWWAQALASRGYAVLQPQFRGSAGYGDALRAAGFGEWGRKMQTDLSDGVRHLAAQGIIDPARVCIVGGSYGGYAALAGAAFDPGVYRCASSLAGPSDLRAMLGDETRGPSERNALRYWQRFMGAKSASDPALAAISPALHADKVTIPLQLIHGRDDTVVLYRQSQIMADAMAKAGKPVEFVTLQSEDHWLSRGATRQQMLAAMVAFLEKHNPPN